VPAAWPEGLEGQAGEVVLELLLDEKGQVSDVKVMPHQTGAWRARSRLHSRRGACESQRR